MFPMALEAGAEAIEGVKAVLTQLQADMDISTVVSVVGVALSASVGFFLLYWGGRKIVGAIQAGMKKGKLKGF